MEEDKVNPIVIVGQGNVGKAIAQHLGESDKKIIIVGDHVNNTITVNGQTYQEIPKEKPKKYLNGRMGGLLAMASMMTMTADMNYGYPSGGHNGPERPTNIDIVKEYALIQQKKSHLSRSDREWVVRVFESKYRKVDNSL